MNIYINSKQEDFLKVIDFFKKEIARIRTGRANSSILDSVNVDAYGIKNPVNVVANISIADGNSILVIPWDKGTIKNIEKAIVDSNLGVGITNEGDKIRITIPQMTEEKRKELVKKLNKKYEKARIALRQVREDIKENIEIAFSNKDIGEDDKFSFIKELDKEISVQNDILKNIKEKKEKDIITI